MPKLTRYLQKIFANNSNEVGVFGTGVDKETSKNVETLQSADYEEGWSSAIITNKNYPIWQEMDGVQYGLSYQLKYLFQNGIPEWISTETYYTNQFCAFGEYIYQSLQDNNINHNPALNDGYWTVYSSVSDDRLHALKSYKDAGELLTDAEGLSDVKEYAHSTFDLSKFTVTGSPTITDDGIASGFSDSNYLEASINFNRQDTIEGEFTTSSTINTSQTIFYGINSDTPYLLSFGLHPTGLILWYGGTSDVWVNVIPNANLLPNHSYHFKIEKDKITVDNYTASINIPSVTETKIIFGKPSHGDRVPFAGQIDLKQFSITADGVEVFSGNKTGVDTYTINGSTVTIPYTLSKTGSKIVQSVYRDRVSDMYNQFGFAPYYTLSETNFTIPQGEVYGAINKMAKDIVHPVAEPFFRFSNEINDDEVRLEGAEVDKGLYLAIEQKLADYCTAGSTPDKICLPNFRDRVPWGANNQGYISAGLPNVTGSVNSTCSGSNGSLPDTSGAISVSGTAVMLYGAGSGPSVNNATISFDASSSSSIYSNSVTTVQPPAFKVRWLARYK